MPAPLVVAALISAGTQLLMNRNQPTGQFQPASFSRSPTPAFQPPPAQRGNPLQSMIMEAFLKKQTGLGATPSMPMPRGPTGLGDFGLMRQPPPIGPRGF